jgi:hypothetical protein
MTTKQKTNDPEKFFSALKMKDVEKIRKTGFFFMMAALISSFFVTMAALLIAFAVTMKPTPVIAFDSDGKRAVFSGEETVHDETTKVRVHRFISQFIEKFEGVSPNIDEDLTVAYNMLTPRFRQILLDKSVHREKIELWKNKNFQTKFNLLTLKFVKGSLSIGSTLTVEGIGEMQFKNVIDYNNEGVQKKDFVYFSAILVVTPVSFDLSPDGLFVEFYKGSVLGDYRSLRAFLMEQKKEYLLEDESGEVFE